MAWYESSMMTVKHWVEKIVSSIRAFFERMINNEATRESYGWLAMKGAGIAAGTMLMGGLLSKGIDKVLNIGQDSGFFKKYVLGLPLKIIGYVLAALGAILTFGNLPKWLNVDQRNVDQGNPRRVTATGVGRAAYNKTTAMAENVLSKTKGKDKGPKSNGKSKQKDE